MIFVLCAGWAPPFVVMTLVVRAGDCCPLARILLYTAFCPRPHVDFVVRWRLGDFGARWCDSRIVSVIRAPLNGKEGGCRSSVGRSREREESVFFFFFWSACRACLDTSEKGCVDIRILVYIYHRVFFVGLEFPPHFLLW